MEVILSKQLNLLGAIGCTGYGVATFNVLKCLTERDWKVALFPKGLNHGRSNDREKQLIQRSADNSKLYPADGHCLHIWHQFDLAVRVGRGRHFAWPIFELDTFNEQEIHHLSNVGYGLIVCSEWGKWVIEKSGIKTTTHVVPLGVDLSIFRAVAPPTDGPTIFLNLGKWEVRKGHDILADIFNAAFTEEDDVELWLAPHNPFLTATESKNWANMYLDSKLGKAGKIKILPWAANQQELAALIGKATCGVFPTRAEGWNLEGLEMMAMNKPVIITYYSGQTEYCKVANSFLVNVDEVEPAYDGKWFFEQGNWAKLGDDQIEQFVSHMRLVYYNSINTNEAGLQTARQFTWDHSADLLEKILLDSP